MINWEILLSGSNERFKNVVKLLISGYILATVLSVVGIGNSGVTNMASAVHFFKLFALSDWIRDTYETLGSGYPNLALFLILLVWAILSCLTLFGTYRQQTPTTLMSNADISAALVLSLWIDLASSGKILNLGFVLIIGTLVCILFKCGKESFFVAILGFLVSPLYFLIAPLLWFASPDNPDRVDGAVAQRPDA